MEYVFTVTLVGFTRCDEERFLIIRLRRPITLFHTSRVNLIQKRIKNMDYTDKNTTENWCGLKEGLYHSQCLCSSTQAFMHQNQESNTYRA